MKRTIFLVFFLLAGCQDDSEQFIGRDKEEVNAIWIEYGSTNVHLELVDTSEIEIILETEDNGQGFIVEEEYGELNLHLKRDMKRLFHLEKMPHMVVRIPEAFEGDIQLNGSSGKVEGKTNGNLLIEGSSGRVDLELDNLTGDLEVRTTSGNVKVFTGEELLDVRWVLESKSGNRKFGQSFNPSFTSKGKTEGAVGNGKNLLSIQTSSGNIELK